MEPWEKEPTQGAKSSGCSGSGEEPATEVGGCENGQATGAPQKWGREASEAEAEDEDSGDEKKGGGHGVLRGNLVVLNECLKFFGAEIGEDFFAVYEERRGVALPREGEHRIVIGFSGENVDEFVRVAMGIEPVLSHDAPWASPFDVEF